MASRVEGRSINFRGSPADESAAGDSDRTSTSINGRITNPVAALSIHARAENSILTALSLNNPCVEADLFAVTLPRDVDRSAFDQFFERVRRQSRCEANDPSEINADITTATTDTFRSCLKGIDILDGKF